MTFKHYIITRFNLSQRWDKDSLGNKVLDDNWLKNRFQLFENYCFPSLKSQTNKNFEWWVLNVEFRQVDTCLLPPTPFLFLYRLIFFLFGIL